MHIRLTSFLVAFLIHLVGLFLFNKHSPSSSFEDSTFACSLKRICHPRGSAPGIFGVICERAHSREKSEVPNPHALRWGCPGLSPELAMQKHGLLGVCSASCFCSFVGWFHCWKWPPSLVPERCLVFLSARRLCWARGEEIQVLDKLHSGMNYSLLAESSMLMNQQCVLTKVSLNRKPK